MTIHQLKAPCWLLEPSPYGDDDYGVPHYDAELKVVKALLDLREERKGDPEGLAALKDVRAKRGESPCWVAECDSAGCDETYEDNENGGNHFDSPKTLMEWAHADGWTQKAPDLVYCWTDRDEGEPLPPTPAELEVAGQLPIPGVAP